MRVMRKGEDGKWSTEEPEDVMRWIWKWDGHDAVVVDDEAAAYYCGNETIRDGYAKKGKTALMFHDLGMKLWDAKQKEEWGNGRTDVQG